MLRYFAVLAAAWLAMTSIAGPSAGQVRWDFATGDDGWQPAHECRLEASGGVLRVTTTGADPFMHSPPIRVAGPVQVRFRARFATSGQARLYWTVLQPSLVSSPWSENAVVYFDVAHDNQWHEQTIPVDADGTITQIRLDPGKSAGLAEFESIEITPLVVAEAAGPGGAPAKPVSIADGPLHVTFDPSARAFTVVDALTKRTWRSDRVRGVRVTSARKTGPDRMLVAIEDMSSELRAACHVTVRDGVVAFSLAANDPSARFGRLAFPPALRTPMTAGALVFTNRSCGQIVDQAEKGYPVAGLGSYSNLGLDMPWVGLVDRARGDGVMLLLETPCDASVDFARDAEGRMWPQVRWLPAKGAWAYERTASYRFSRSGGYGGLARVYRAYADVTGLTKTLAAKAKDRPRVAELRGAPSIWGIGGGRDRIGDPVEVARQLRAFGIRRAILNLATDVPDAAIAPMNALGFLTGEYDNYDDVREGPNGITSGPVEKHALRLADGSKATGWLNEDGSQMYRRSSSVVTDVARQVVPDILKRRPFSARFLDVTSTVDLMEDYSQTQGYDRRGDLKNRLRLYDYVRSLGLVVGGEHGKAWCLPVVDYAEGKLSGPFWWEMPAGYLKVPKTRDDIKPNYLRWGVNPAARIPLWDLAFHDCMVSTWYWGDCNGYYTGVAPELDDFQDLTTMLYGGVPLFWLNHLSYGWNRNRGRLLESYWVTCKLHEVIGFDRMASHRVLTPDSMVQQTRFSSGAVVTVNYGDKPFALRGKGTAPVVLAPHGFAASAAGVAQERALVGGSPITRVQGDGFLVVRTARLARVGPVQVNGRAFCWRMGPHTWRAAVECEGTCRIGLGGLAGSTVAHGRVVPLTDAGEPAAPAEECDTEAQLPAGTGLRLFEIAW